MFGLPPLPRSLEASFRDVGSTRPEVRVSALRDLVRHAVESEGARTRAVPFVERALREDAAAAVRAEAALALADLRAYGALPALLFAVEDADTRVRQMAIAAVGELGDSRARSRLERALSDARPEVRYQAVIAYPRVAGDDSKAVATALGRALVDEDSAIRYIAMRVVEELEIGGGPLKDEAVARRAEALVGEPDDAVAVVAGLYLTKLGSACGRSIVFDVIAERRSTPELEDEQACVELAGELRWMDAVPHLERRTWSSRRLMRTILSWGAGDRSSCAWHARTALARMGHERARSEILADLASWRRETREAAVVAAGRAGLADTRAVLESLGSTVDAHLLRDALASLAHASPAPGAQAEG